MSLVGLTPREETPNLAKWGISLYCQFSIRCEGSRIFNRNGRERWSSPLSIASVSGEEPDEEITIGADWLAYQSMEEADKVTPFAFLVLPRSAKQLRLQIDARGLRERAEGLPPIWKELHRFPQLKQEESP